MSMKKIIVGICSLAMLAASSMLNLSAYVAPPDWDFMPDNFDFYRGDVSENFEVDIEDIIIMQRYLHGNLPYSFLERDFRIADMNEDNAVNIYDLILLKKSSSVR